MTGDTNGTYVNPQKVDLVKLKQKLSPIKKKHYATNSESENVSLKNDNISTTAIAGINLIGINSMSLLKGPIRRSSVSPLKNTQRKEQRPLQYGHLSLVEDHSKGAQRLFLKPLGENKNMQKHKSIFNGALNSVDASPAHKHTPKTKKMENSIFSGFSVSPAARRIESMLLQSNSNGSRSPLKEKDRKKEDLFEFTMSVDRKKTLRRIRSVTEILGTDTSYDSLNKANSFKKIQLLCSSNSESDNQKDTLDRTSNEEKKLSSNYNNKRPKIKDDLEVGLPPQKVQKSFFNFSRNIEGEDNHSIDEQFDLKGIDVKLLENKGGITTLTGSPISRISHIHENNMHDFEILDGKNTSGSEFLKKMKATMNRNTNAGVQKKVQELKSCLKQRHSLKDADQNKYIDEFNEKNNNSRGKYVTFSSEIEELQADNTVTRSRKFPKSVESENDDYLTDNDLEEETQQLGEEVIDIKHNEHASRDRSGISYPGENINAVESRKDIKIQENGGNDAEIIDNQIWKELSDKQLEILKNLNLINLQIKNCEKIQKSIVLESLQISELLIKHNKRKKKKGMRISKDDDGK